MGPGLFCLPPGPALAAPPTEDTSDSILLDKPLPGPNPPGREKCAPWGRGHIREGGVESSPPKLNQKEALGGVEMFSPQ